jgi:hypothetical protein
MLSLQKAAEERLNHPYYIWQNPIAFEWVGCGILVIKFQRPIVNINPDDRLPSISGFLLAFEE